MKRLLPLAAFLLAWSPCSLAAQFDPAIRWPGTQPVPEGAKVTLEFDKAEYFLGENVLVHFILENAGAEAFEASFGHDYRGATRHLRFKVTATNQEGVEAEDPDLQQHDMGGFGGPVTLKPGETFVQSLPLMRYCRINEPGLYTIRATHDFGWSEEERKRPVGETTVTFLLPDAAQAERIVSEMEQLPAYGSSSRGERTGAYADFRCLDHPVYLDPLVRRARAGDERVFAGLGRIGTQEATKTLIQLANETDAKVALGAAQTLLGRLPVPVAPHMAFGFHLERRRLAELSWDGTLAPDARAVAKALIEKPGTQDVAAGARIIEAIGEPEDAPAVLAALDRALQQTNKPRREPKDNILDLPQPVRELTQAMDALHGRGFALGEGLSGHAQIFLWFRWLANDPPPRPPRWQQMMEAFATASPYPLREAVIRSIPLPLADEHVPFIMRGLSDSDLGVCRAACNMAGASGDTEFLQPILDIIATEHHEWLLYATNDAAKKLGAGFELYETWADRLGEEHLFVLALRELVGVLELPSSGGGRTDLSREERLELRKAWKVFLSEHAEEIRAGKRFAVTDPAVTPALAGRGAMWQLPDGTTWPP